MVLDSDIGRPHLTSSHGHIKSVTTYGIIPTGKEERAKLDSFLHKGHKGHAEMDKRGKNVTLPKTPPLAQQPTKGRDLTGPEPFPEF